MLFGISTGEKVVIQLKNINKFTKVDAIRTNNYMIVRNLPNSYTYYYRSDPR